MIHHQTVLTVSDNSGARNARCIKVLGGFKRKFAFLGDIILVVICNTRNRSKKSLKVKKGEIYKALIIKTKQNYFNKDGSSLKFDSNDIVLLNKNGSLLANRILGNVPRLLKKRKKSKFGSMSLGIV